MKGEFVERALGHAPKVYKKFTRANPQIIVDDKTRFMMFLRMFNYEVLKWEDRPSNGMVMMLFN